MASIIDRLTALWSRRPLDPPALTLVPTPVQVVNVGEQFHAQTTRRALVLEARQMYTDDPRPAQSINTLARDALKGGFTLQITGGQAARAQAVAEALIQRLDLLTRLDDWTRLTLRDGDTFLELGVANNNEIVLVTRKPTLDVYRYANEYDQFDDPARAFYQTPYPTMTDTPPADAIWFAEWQMVHARWGRDEGSRYGAPLFAAARKAYKRMTQGELDIAVRRKTRSGLRFVHTLEDASLTDIETYKAANKPALDDPFAAAADFFTNKRGGIQVVQGDAHLSEIEDVLHHVDTFGMASPVPLELIGYGRNLNRDVLQQKKEQYEETLGAVRSWIVTEFLRPLLERQWLLLGIWPGGLTWDVQWKVKQEPTPTDMAEMARFVATVKAAGLVTDETLLRVLATVMPDFDIEAELAALATQAAEREEMALRIASNAQVPPDEEPDPNKEPVLNKKEPA